MGDKFKILFSRVGFWDTGNAMKPFTMLCARYFCWIRRIWQFSAVFTHFPSIYHYFETRNIVFGTISMFWVTRNQMTKFRKLSDYHAIYQGCQFTRYFNYTLLFLVDFKRFPSIYKYFNFRKVILVVISILLGMGNIIVKWWEI